MQQILNSKYLRRAFWIACFSILVVLGLVKFFIIGEIELDTPHWVSFSSGIIEALIATLLTTIGVGAFIFYLTPKLDMKKNIEFLSSYEFNDYFDSVLKDTNEWHFRGGFGRFLSTKILPRLNQVASETRAPVVVRAQILDPRNDRLCKIHANLVNSVKSVNSDSKLSYLDVKVYLYSTIITCAIYETNNEYLDISVYLNSFFSTDRVDISTDSGIITKDDRKVPGMVFPKNSSLYRAYMGDLSVTQKQADVVAPLSKSYKIGCLEADDVKNILNDLGFCEDKLTAIDFDKIKSIVNNQKNPY